MANLSEIKKDSNWGEAASTINSNFQNMNVDLEKVKSSTTKFKGYFTTETALKNAYPSPKVGEAAWVGEPYPGTVYDVQVAGTWHNTGKAPDTDSVDLKDYARKEELTEVSNKVAGINYVTCDTAASTAAKTVSITGLTSLTTGIRLLVKMTNNNTASNATLNINSLGAKPLYYDNERASSDNSWEAGEVIDVYYDGTNFYAGNVQGGSSDGGNKTLTWNTDAATTRKQVQLKDRKELLQISYKDGEGNAVNEQYIGTSVDDTEWSKDNNWIKIPNQEQLNEILNKISNAEGGNLILEWNTDEVTTRKSILSEKRKQGMQISYKKDEEFVNEQFIGSDLSDEKFPLSSYWMSLQESYEFYDGWQSGYLNSSGAFGSSGNYKYLPYISLPDTVKNVYLFNTFKVEAGTKGICFYDENQTFIAGYDTETGVRTYPKPEGAKFFRVCKGKNMDGRVALSKNEILDSLLQTEDETSGESYTNIIGDIPTSLFKKGLVKKDGSINAVAWQYLDFIKVVPGTKIGLKVKSSTVSSGVGGFLLYAFYSNNNNKSFISGKSYEDGESVDFEEEITVPDNGYYMRITGVGSKSSILNLNIPNSVLLTYPIIPEAENKTKTLITVPKYIDCPSWRQTDLFLDNLIGKVTDIDANTVIYTEITQIGYSHLRVKNLNSNLSVNIIQYRDFVSDDIDNNVTFTLRSIKKTSTKNSWNILVIGDSLIQSTTPVEELYKLLQEDGDVTINMIGTQGNSPYKHEGRGGWTFAKFLSSDSPFYKNGKIDFKEYLKSVNPELTTIDIIIMSLGTNDIGGGNVYASSTTVNTAIENAKSLVDYALDADTGFPDAKILVGMPAVGSPYMKTSVRFKMSAILLNDALIKNFDNGAYSANVTCVAHGAYIDRINNYQHTDSNISEYNEQQVSTYINLLHPYAAGYRQFGRGYYGKVRAILAGNL